MDERGMCREARVHVRNKISTTAGGADCVTGDVFKPFETYF